MITETSTAPTVVAVAKRADVSVRSVFQHFGDVESLFVTVFDSVRQDIVVPPRGSERPARWRPASTSVVENLAEVFDKIVPLRVAAGQFVDHPALIERGEASKQELRTPLSQAFAPEFADLDEQARRSWRTPSARPCRWTPGSCCAAATASSFERGQGRLARMTLTAPARPCIASTRTRPNWHTTGGSPIDLAFEISDLGPQFEPSSRA